MSSVALPSAPATAMPAPLPRALRGVLSLDDFERLAQRHLPRPIWAYVSGAVEDNHSLAENRRAFADLAFRPRVLAGVAQRDLSFALFGRRYAAPIGLAPMGISALSAYRGDIVLAQAAQQANVPAIMSGSSLIRLEEVMAAAPQTWFQAYLPGDQAQIDALLARVQAAGVQTLVITVDTPVGANRENNVRAGFSTPLKPSLSLAWQGMSHPRWLLGTFVRTLLRHGMPHFENNYATRGAPILSANVLRDFSDRAHLNWTHLAAIRRRWPGTLVIKGILTPEDAVIARDHGADGLIVSNHGGRQLDGVVAPLRVLPAIVRAVPGLPVMLDSGVRRGTDAVKALALGARCVFVGRPFNYAASVAGLAGVAHAIGLLRDEVSRDMAMLGLTRLDQITPACIRPVADPRDYFPSTETHA
ncbi:alpha-hydroxy acid oxidase [Pseudorhodoferax sp. Leaf267]|uniref:alpha-hydroxy acid oxidase n=1 Tax=Pseudorhodoferax sp. Leaf267 TaxID=1736316 RepID=UPI0006FBE489|nr:alpha-hydroxy acid oxidase [Pseudorhodoferax sp. Leaf267]KQP13265.1 2-hydroxy-acid oxidase [Pseudorhodoferax sp. Leaf267]